MRECISPFPSVEIFERVKSAKAQIFNPAEKLVFSETCLFAVTRFDESSLNQSSSFCILALFHSLFTFSLQRRNRKFDDEQWRQKYEVA